MKLLTLRTAILSAAAMGASLGPIRATILINEAHIDPPGQVNAADGDGNFEYIELISTTGGVESADGLWILQVDVRGGGIGVVKEAWNLSGLSTGPNGLLLLGDGYDNTGGGPWSGQKANGTTVGDPPSMGGDNLDDNDAFCLLLVRGFTGIAESGTTVGTDIDTNDDGTLSVTFGTLPWAGGAINGLAGVIDSVGFSHRAEFPTKRPLAAANLTRSGYDPGNVSRRAGNVTANSMDAWYGGALDGTSLNSTSFSANRHFGLVNGAGVAAPGEATPGSPNFAVAPAAAVFRINEVSLNPSGSPDGNAEYIEISSGDRGYASLSGLTLLVIDSNNEPPELAGPGFFGEILEAWSLDGLATGSNGLILLGDGYAPGQSPWGSFVSPDTALADPPGFGLSDIGDNNGFTLMLVRGFSGAGASPSSAGTDVDANDDGLVDNPRWTEVVDDIGFDQVDPLNPAAAGLGKTYATARILTTPAYDPDHFSRLPGNQSARSASAWFGGDYGGGSRLSIGLRADTSRPPFGPHKGEASPGRPNAGAAPVPGRLLINEVNFRPAQSPDPNANNEEFIELISDPPGIAGMHDLTLLIVDASAPAQGQISEAISLAGLSTGPNGLCLIGDAYDNGTPYGSEVSMLSNREDPPGYDAGDIARDADGFVILLVRGFSGTRGQDIDPDDDGEFEIRPWSAVSDAVSVGAVTDADVTTLAAPPGIRMIARHQGDFRRVAGAWHGGDFAENGSMVAWGARRFGVDYVSAASPGRWNPTATPLRGGLVLNEVMINVPSGPDGNREFIELLAAADGAFSTNGYSLVMIDSSVGNNLTGNVGRVLEAWHLDGLSTGPNGLLLLGDGYPAGFVPWTAADAPDPETQLGDPEGMDTDDIGLDSDNGALSLLLVKHFTGAVGEDLDVIGGAAGAGDGQFDLTPWAQIADSVAMRFWNAAPTVPPAKLEGITYGGCDVSQIGYTPDMVARIRGRLTTASASAWAGGDLLSGTTLVSGGFPATVTVQLTPGRINPADTEYLHDTSDPDGDGLPNFLEEALLMNPHVATPDGLPQPTVVSVGSNQHAALSWRQRSGGVGSFGAGYVVDGIRYHIEISDDLLAWREVAPAEVVIVGLVDEPATSSTALTMRLAAPGLPKFLRIKVSRT